MSDLRYAFWTLLKSPGFTVLALLTLALGIGINTAMFTLVDSILLRPLSYPHPARLAAIDQVYSTTKSVAFRAWSYPRFEDFRDRETSFQSIAAFSSIKVSLTGAGDPEVLDGECVSADYFRTLDADALLGRVFLDEEDRAPGADPVAIVSYRLWMRRFGGDRAIVGRGIRVNETALTVIGVMPRDFRSINPETDIWVPMMMAPAVFENPKRLSNPNSYWHQVIGRLRPGVTLERAAAEARTLDPQLQQLHPSPRALRAETRVSSLLEAKTDPSLRRSLLILFVAVGFVLLIACANLANLLLSRSAARRKEASIRVALGASRGRLLRHYLTESVLLAILGGVAGLIVALWGVDLATSLQPGAGSGFWSRYARALDREAIRMDAWVLVFNLAASCATGLLFGIVPAWQASRATISARLHDLRRAGSRSALIVAEVALALVLLAGAGLMTATFSRLLRTDLGISADHIATAHIQLPSRKYKPEQQVQLFDRLLGNLGSGASLSNSLPVTGQAEATVAGIEHDPQIFSAGVHVVSPQFFSVMRIGLRHGRLLRPTDRAGAPNVVVINEAAARAWFPGQNPIGRRITLASGWGKTDELKEIVGVVANVKYESIDHEAEPEVYACYLQYPYELMFIAVRTVGDPAQESARIRSAVAALDPDLPVTDLRPMQSRVYAASARVRFVAVLLGVFAVLAGFLAAIGIFGVVSCSVSERTREIGIRIALGAQPATLLRSVTLDGLVLGAAGAAAGLPLAIWATRALSSMLYGVKPGDPATLALTALLLVAVSCAASYLPARRAAKVDPMEALRHE